ncbi:hypothetical protein BLNAU_4064 [Blattamonas nauphoetae]|uniref:4Fe-4S ferredoxin-type domain-containing protein n=1 Tax=Blattamonas nauphoetae TaxID=2049346 RepID=A0ABQ9YB25_9EUKA|nr:hypothetical protein BLNAU_4064 [Blattamonas nauphoetae]
MKVVIMYFSNTGSTLFMSKRIQTALESANHSVVLHDGFAILKQYTANGTSTHTPLLVQYHNDLRDADVVGLGCYVSKRTIPSGTAKLFTEKATPSALFANMKLYFSFASFGSFQVTPCEYLATYLFQRNEQAKYLGSIEFMDPENHIPLQAPRGSIDAVRDSELKKLEDFGVNLCERLNGESLPSMHQIVTETIHPADETPKAPLGPLQINPEKCVHCYRCVDQCPYNALHLPEPGSTVKLPVHHVDECYGCSRCFNLCPVRAIEFPSVKSEKREQYFWGKSHENLKVNPPPSKEEVLSRFRD